MVDGGPVVLVSQRRADVERRAPLVVEECRLGQALMTVITVPAVRVRLGSGAGEPHPQQSDNCDSGQGSACARHNLPVPRKPT